MYGLVLYCCLTCYICFPGDLCRKRHWTQLMEVTGQNFEMDPKTFTLGNMFAMQLHKYAEEIGKITNAAVKELTIESEIKKLSDVWREQKFELGKYMKVRGAAPLQCSVPHAFSLIWCCLALGLVSAIELAQDYEGAGSPCLWTCLHVLCRVCCATA